MIAVLIFRWLYLILVAVGFFVNYGEFRAARIVYNTLVMNRINGARQVLASHFVRKALMLVGIQFFLIIPAIVGIAALPRHEGPSNLNVNGWILIATLAHMAAVLCLMLMAIMSWYDRTLAMNMISSDISHERDDAITSIRIELNDVADELRKLREDKKGA
jgi:uncharacterized membrane protein